MPSCSFPYLPKQGPVATSALLHGQLYCVLQEPGHRQNKKSCFMSKPPPHSFEGPRDRQTYNVFEPLLSCFCFKIEKSLSPPLKNNKVRL